MKREIFCKNIEPYLKAGVMKEIFFNDYFSVMNMANSCYTIFIYKEKTEEEQFGILVIPEVAKEATNDPFFFARYLNAKGADWINKHVVQLNERNFKIMLDLKKNTDIEGPSPDIDLEFEARMLGKGKNR